MPSFGPNASYIVIYIYIYIYIIAGNSAYGSLLLDKTKHRNVQYIKGERLAHMKVNDLAFIGLTELSGDLFEVELSKSRITLDLPVVLGFAILQYAKLRMLQFYYDCLDKYIDRTDIERTEMDTDSLYFAISGKNLEDVIKPDIYKNSEIKCLTHVTLMSLKRVGKIGFQDNAVRNTLVLIRGPSVYLSWNHQGRRWFVSHQRHMLSKKNRTSTNSVARE